MSAAVATVVAASRHPMEMQSLDIWLLIVAGVAERVACMTAPRVVEVKRI
jgi:hypothetical protein